MPAPARTDRGLQPSPAARSRALAHSLSEGRNLQGRRLQQHSVKAQAGRPGRQGGGAHPQVVLQALALDALAARALGLLRALARALGGRAARVGGRRLRRARGLLRQAGLALRGLGGRRGRAAALARARQLLAGRLARRRRAAASIFS